MKTLILPGKITLLICGCLIGIAASAQKPLYIATTAVPFLRIAPDARSGGMGDAGIAMLPDAGSAFWNIGKVVFNEENGGAAASRMDKISFSNLIVIVRQYIAGYLERLGLIKSMEANAPICRTGNPTRLFCPLKRT